MSNEINKLEVGPDGVLKETGVKKVDINHINHLQEINYVPVNHEIVVQVLPEKSITTASGIVLPESKREFKAAVVAVQKDSKFKRGQVIRLDGEFFLKMNPETRKVDVVLPVHYIDNKPLLQVPEHFVKGIYTNVDLSNWK